MNGSEAEHYQESIEGAVKIALLMKQSGINAIEVSCRINIRKLGAIKGKIPTDIILQEKTGVAALPGFIKPLLRPMIPFIIGKPDRDRLYNLEAARRIKENVSVPIILVGGQQ